MTAAHAMDDEPAELELVDSDRPRRRLARRLTLPSWVQTDSPAFVWIGIAVALAGFVLIGIGWGQVAGETQVYLQLPYLVSAGLTGLGLIMVGVTIVDVAAERRDAVERERQMDQLVSILEELKATMDPKSSRRR